MNILLASVAVATASATPQVSAGAALARTAGSLLVILLLIIGLAWLARRLPLARGNSAASVRAESGLRLGARERLVIVNVEGRRLLLGVASGRIELLTELAAETEETNTFNAALDAAIETRKEPRT